MTRTFKKVQSENFGPIFSFPALLAHYRNLMYSILGAKKSRSESEFLCAVEGLPSHANTLGDLLLTQIAKI